MNKEGGHAETAKNNEKRKRRSEKTNASKSEMMSKTQNRRNGPSLWESTQRRIMPEAKVTINLEL